ncbi:GNAT family N-acetyltransferase [Metabacillus idriensis]|uniref:GNAT family N-acetyltransferase n=1 Tax=Bacillaceae TaxID=186817 RepID=UPI00105A13CE|nr:MULTISPECIES: GNAT family N-acetyltransferase [Bacillaceae]MDR0137225.1 GNAT family N-acetyltransferase [Metabacillus idriensis]TDL80000.1 N-acetyltransferase [Peribacillus frigoritolerans]
MIEIVTDRLLIIPCSLDIAKSLVFHRKELESRSPIGIPVTWPSTAVKGMLPLYIERLERNENEYGWGLWLIILYHEKRIVGDLFLQGMPDEHGCVELCYNIHEVEDEESLTFEAIEAVIEWLTSEKSVIQISMECIDHNKKSIRLFEKLGMICTKKEDVFLSWELKKKA